MYIKKNHDWVDNVKGIGIISVVAGHVFTNQISDIIFLFHMPLFFFLGGYLFSPKNNKSYFLKKTNSLLFPYIKYLCIFTLLILLQLWFNNLLTINKLLKVLAVSIYGGKLLTGWLGVFWFITVFFATQQLLNLLINSIQVKKCGIIAILALLTSYAISRYKLPPIPLNLDVVLYALPLMYAGYVAKHINIDKYKLLYIIISIIGIIIFLMYPKNMHFDMKSAQYGFPLLNFIVSIAITLSIIEVCKKVKNKTLLFAGVNSMSIMYIHQFIHFAILDKIIKNQPLLFVFTTALSLVYCLCVNKFSQKKERLNAKA